MKFLTLVFAIPAITIFASLLARATEYSDAQIAEIMRVANDGEINLAKEAQIRGIGYSARTFSKEMVDEHSKNKTDLQNLTNAQVITYAESPLSRRLLTEATADIQKIRKVSSSTDLERAYISAQVSMHQNLLNSLDNDLITSAQNEELKNYLSTTREHVAQHLDEAKKISAKD